MAPSVGWTDESVPYLDIGKEGYRLTPIRLTDIEDWTELKNDPAVKKQNVFDKSQMSHEKAEAQIRALLVQNDSGIDDLKQGRRSKYAPFVAIRSPEGRLIGECHLADPMAPDPEIPEGYAREYRHPRFGYAILSSYSGRGITFGAARALIEFARDHLESDTIAAGAANANPASQAILTKLGFQIVHHFKKTYETPAGAIEIDGPWYILKLRRPHSGSSSFLDCNRNALSDVLFPDSERKMDPLVKWAEHDQPYLELKDGFRLTPIYLGDVDDYLLLKNEIASRVERARNGITREEAETSITTQIDRSIASIADLRAGNRAEWAPFFAIRTPNGRVVGICTFAPPFVPPPYITGDLRAQFDCLYISYALLRAYRGRGIATSAAQAIVQYAREHMLSEMIGGGANLDNPASMAILRKVGFQHVHTFKDVPTPDGEIADAQWNTLKLR